MKLTRLRLLGFKSFVEPTDVLIEPGLTGVVGPNGCGKSNLVEALRWVMGETSHKSLRAADMDDVIFSGTNNRPGRNHAEVAVQIDNGTRDAPAQFNEHEVLDVSRRLEREAGSTYRINGREVRARDVHILFADASTGSRSPAMVHQGRIGEIIQARPDQRRRVLEEAAGISGLHARRHEAELRLRAAEQNLNRLEDVITQLAGQMDALKRQARQAVRYRNVSEQVRKSEAMLFHLRWSAATGELANAEHGKHAAMLAVAQRTGEQAEASRLQANVAAQLPELRQAEAAAAAALQRLLAARDALDNEENRARARLAELDRRLQQLTQDIERERLLASDADAAMARLAGEESALRQEAETNAAQAAGISGHLAGAETAVASAEARADKLTAELADLAARRRSLETALGEQDERLRRLFEEIAAVEAERQQLQAEEFADLAALAKEADASARQLAELEAEVTRAEGQHKSARETTDAARAALLEAERRAQRLETEAKTLGQLLQVESNNIWPAVIDDLAVEKGCEAALAAALGDDLDAPIDPAAPMRWAGASIGPDDPALPPGVECLADRVAAPRELARRMQQIGLVDREHAAHIAPMLKPGQRLVSREGDLWRWDGFSVAANAPTGAARRLAAKNRLADLEAELQKARAEADAKEQAAASAEVELATLAKSEAAARALWRTRKQEADAARDRCIETERSMSRNTARLSALNEAVARLAANRDEAGAARAQAETEIARLSPASALEGELAAARAHMDAERARLAELRAQAQALAREAEVTARRLAAIAVDTQGWRERQDGAAAQLATLEARLAETNSERAELQHAPQLFEEKRRALLSEIEGAERKRREAADRLAQGENELADADRMARAALEAVSATREEAARAEEKLEGAKRRLADVEHEIQEMLEVEASDVANLAGADAGKALPEVSQVEQDLERLRRERERLGAVNLRAEEELREITVQHDKLACERDDLVEAIKRLRHGIQSLNREARERLLASFEVVNEHFKRLFTRLFGGGNAELHLIESEDPLEAGLEIIAKPPGKKPATLSLLSGGEQALTALALIFAVFLTNPAPICVLDEVDAPLDDHNIERFCDLLDEMTRSTDTRFLIITHNPITMARMNRLYGVTMAERGISQLVSVDLEEAVKLREAV
ncbi:MAG TPA: AAA family ATPase [Xanthobacteraceae bacterium]